MSTEISEVSEESSLVESSEASSEQLPDVCRYCLETQSEIGELGLFRPCKCTNPICVKCFVKRHNYGEDILLTCEICRSKFSDLDSFFKIAKQKTVKSVKTVEEDDKEADKCKLATLCTGFIIFIGLMVMVFLFSDVDKLDDSGTNETVIEPAPFYT